MADITHISRRGTITLPAPIRRKLGLAEGDVLMISVSDGSIVLTPAAVTPVELYTDERVAEFDRNAELAPGELERARRAWDAAGRA